MHFTRVIVFHERRKPGGWSGDSASTSIWAKLPCPAKPGALDLAQLVRKVSAQMVPTSALGLNLEARMASRNAGRCALTAILHNNRPLCYCGFWPASNNASQEDLLGSVNGVRGEVEETFLKIISRRTLLDKEKNEVSVHLSTNLGHDLTNIIATGKWDLETLKRGVDMGIVKVHGQPIQEQRFKEAVQGLVNNSRMLQEVVNIYRAFGYANRPTYERVDVNRLVEGLARLFELSTSKSVAVGLKLHPDLPHWVLEPRMIKLVLFNMLSNSIQAISKLQEQGKETSGEIVIETDLSEEKWLEIRILDAGTGSKMNRETHDPVRTQENFRYGFTTSETRPGEGWD
jgi:signal transduction histidine kinase